jgi:hypothetical protein
MIIFSKIIIEDFNMSKSAGAKAKIYSSFDDWNNNFFPATKGSDSDSEKNIDEVAKCLANISVDQVLRAHPVRRHENRIG